MDIVIREDIGQYMKELKQWITETRDCSLEEMGDFFSARIDGYEDHMSLWKRAYQRFAGLVPENCTDILDLGCGTGLELDEIFKRFPDVSVTGIDLCRKLNSALKAGGTFLLGDYIACCEEEEELLFAACREKREKFHIPEKQFVHFDTPLTLDHEIRLLEAADFSRITAVDCIDGATIIRAEK